MLPPPTSAILAMPPSISDARGFCREGTGDRERGEAG
jgi:hypothetical protein